MSAEGKKSCPQPATDVELLNAIAQQSERAFEELRDRYAALVRSVIGGVLKNSCPWQEREEVESEVWIRVWKYRRPFNEQRGGTVPGLLAQIARNAALSHRWRYWQRQSRELNVDKQELEVLKSTESASEWLRNVNERRFIVSDLVDHGLSELNDVHLNVVVSAINNDYEQLSYKEIAERLGLTESNVKIIIHRFKKRYLKLLEEYRKNR
jgi:RNA polymerase sigma factor (sigma-70 family)